MDQTETQQNASCMDYHGKLPSCAPLANPYVPYQRYGAAKYLPGKGISRGTLFKGLDLPFHDMVNEADLDKTLMQKIQNLSFATTELGLYLDTHKEDTEALSLFNKYKELYGELIAEYQAKYGPLMQLDAGGNGKYDWLADPWPWNYQKEG